MTPYLKTAMGLALSISLSACGAHDIATLKSKSIDQTTFSGAVADKYRKFVIFEADEMMDWQDAGYFASKALRILENPNAAKPENFADWHIKERFIHDLTVGEARLKIAMQLFDPEEVADDLASAITSFDCWIEQAEEGWQDDHIAACQKAFNDALTSLEGRKGIAITDTGEARANLIVHHNLDEAAPRAEDLVLVRSFAKRGWDDLQLHVHVTGHTDRSGSTTHNKKLSVSRALALVDAIRASWPGEYTFSIEGLGEDSPVVQTPDGVQDIRNRRTEAKVILSIKPQHPLIETATR
jgi:outer membrane protein OmpA-like peptidoglycan-associated protein